MRRLLIISPHFPPINAADMHRVRHSLPYFADFGWQPTVLAVDPDRVDGTRDDLLLRTVPDAADVRHVGAFAEGWTRSLGVGNPALRSLLHYAVAGSRIIGREGVDLVYFSTTQFPVAVLGRLWKALHGVPYVIDVQDPWLSDHHLRRPKSERPPKAWWAYQMHRVLEPIAMTGVDGIVSVSDGYVDTLTERYDAVRRERCRTIPFGAAGVDFDVLDEAQVDNPFFGPEDDAINVAYVGRAGDDMDQAARGLFRALARGLDRHPDLFGRLQLFFIGTRYAPDGEGRPALAPIAREYGVADHVTEQTDRIPYFQAMNVLREADMAVLLGSTDPQYTASKLYPYILARRPLLAVFNENSSVVDVLRDTGAGTAATYRTETDAESLSTAVLDAWTPMLRRLPYVPDTHWDAFAPYTAAAMTRRQVEFFDEIVPPTESRPSDAPRSASSFSPPAAPATR
jgi:hypothetical protein